MVPLGWFSSLFPGFRLSDLTGYSIERHAVDPALILHSTQAGDHHILKIVLDITLLGPPQISLEGQPLVLRPRNSARQRRSFSTWRRAVALNRAKRLVPACCGRIGRTKRRANILRGELFLLSGLRQKYLLEVDGRLSLNPQNCRIDMARFCELTEDPHATVEQLDTALRLWSGTFLEGVESAVEAGAALFVEWLDAQRSGWESARARDAVPAGGDGPRIPGGAHRPGHRRLRTAAGRLNRNTKRCTGSRCACSPWPGSVRRR